MKPPLNVIVLAAGEGKRFSSHLAKPFHCLAGLELVGHVLKSVENLNPYQIRVVIQEPYQDKLEQVLDKLSLAQHLIQISYQKQAKGTGHATKIAQQDMEKNTNTSPIPAPANILILPADVPLVTTETLRAFIDFHTQHTHDISVMGFQAEHTKGYGRLIMDSNKNLQRIQEEKDCSDAERNISLCNSGILLLDSSCLTSLLAKLTNDNAQKEYYLTDIIAHGKKINMTAKVYTCCDASELHGINTRSDFTKVELQYQERRRAYFLDTIGVSITAPHTVFFHYDTLIERDTTLGPYVVFGPNVSVGKSCEIKAFSDIAEARIGDHVSIGPFARIRGNATIADEARIGNFVEIKHSHLGKRSKATHLAYMGDAQIGDDVNIGAGVVFANYDGRHKYPTTVMDKSFIGSNSTLVAPLVIGKQSMVTAGSTIVEDVPENSRSFARSRQTNKSVRQNKKANS